MLRDIDEIKKSVDYVMAMLDSLHMSKYLPKSINTISIKLTDESKYTLDEAGHDLEIVSALYSNSSQMLAHCTVMSNRAFYDTDTYLYHNENKYHKAVSRSSTNYGKVVEGMPQNEQIFLTYNVVKALYYDLKEKMNSLRTIIATKRDILKTEYNSNVKNN